MAYCLHLPSPFLLRDRLACTSEAHHLPTATSGVGRSQVRDMPGSTGTGRRMGIAISGWLGAGIVRPTKGHIGTILIMITTGKAGSCMKGTGIMRITTGTTVMTAITRSHLINEAKRETAYGIKRVRETWVRKPSQMCGEGFLFGRETCLGGPPNSRCVYSIFGCLLYGYYTVYYFMYHPPLPPQFPATL